jgi:CRISPR/Cas system CSM-associated protein Csm2 small subunit
VLCEVIDIVKKHIIYRKPLDRSLLVKTMTRFEESLFQLRDMYDLTREQTIKHNMEKLLTGEKARYKLGMYTDEQAQTRQDKQ